MSDADAWRAAVAVEHAEFERVVAAHAAWSTAAAGTDADKVIATIRQLGLNLTEYGHALQALGGWLTEGD